MCSIVSSHFNVIALQLSDDGQIPNKFNFEPSDFLMKIFSEIYWVPIFSLGMNFFRDMLATWLSQLF